MRPADQRHGPPASTLGLDRHQLSATPEGGRPGFLASEAGAFFPGQMIAVNGAGQT